VIRGILLAGGASSRFGAQKLAHPLADGTPIGRQAAINLCAAVDEVVVIHRPGDESVMRIFADLPVTLLASERCLEGMGGSLASAVAASGDADGWIVALADMPFIELASIRAVRDALEDGASIAVPCFEGQRGHPVAFSGDWREALLALQGDEGARRILATHADKVTEVDVPDANIRKDVDRPADLDG
jgi:molybdenum cofactor cytidylyltransferase